MRIEKPYLLIEDLSGYPLVTVVQTGEAEFQMVCTDEQMARSGQKRAQKNVESILLEGRRQGLALHRSERQETSDEVVVKRVSSLATPENPRFLEALLTRLVREGLIATMQSPNATGKEGSDAQTA